MVQNIQVMLNKLSPQLGGIMHGCCQHLQHNFTQSYIQRTSNGEWSVVPIHHFCLFILCFIIPPLLWSSFLFWRLNCYPFLHWHLLRWPTTWASFHLYLLSSPVQVKKPFPLLCVAFYGQQHPHHRPCLCYSWCLWSFCSLVGFGGASGATKQLPFLWVSTPFHPFSKRPLMRMCAT